MEKYIIKSEINNLINNFCEAHGIDFDVSQQFMEEEQK